ncbi:MAG: SNF2-related protein [Oscillochloridaceae bacterium umkhey_bin13]
MLFLLTADTIPIDQLLQTTHPSTVKQGRELHRQGYARVEQSSGTSATIAVEEPGSHSINVRVSLVGNQMSLTCLCRTAYGWGLCKHRVAAALALRDYLKANPPSVWRAVLDQAIQTPPRPRTVGPGNALIFSLQQRGSSWAVVPYSLAGRYLPPNVIPHPDQLHEAIERLMLYGQIKQVRNQIAPDTYPEVPMAAIAAANTAIAAGGNYGYWHTGARTLATILPMLADCLVYEGDDEAPVGDRLTVCAEHANVELEVARSTEALEAHFCLVVGERTLSVQPGETIILTRDPQWILVEDLICRLADQSPAPEVIADYPRLRIPASEESEFLDRYLVPLSQNVSIRGDLVQWEDVSAPAEPRIYLSERESDLIAELRFGYETFELPFEKHLPATSVRRREGSTTLSRIARNSEAEQQAQQALGSGFGLKKGSGPHEFLLRKSTTPADFLLREVPKLAAAGYTIFGEEALTLARVNRNRPSISFKVNSGIDWFDLEAVVQFGDQILPLKDLKRALKRRERYVKLADGSLGVIPEEWGERYRHLFAFAEEHDGNLRLADHHLSLIDQILGEADRANTDELYAERRERLKSFDHVEPQPLPQGFIGDLRTYQKAGYDWLHFLRTYGFGGCLADDMGMGKTIQALAFLQAIYEEQPRPAATLIVMPRSLLFNWQREAAQFAPNLRVYIHADQGRISQAEQFGGYDLVLTTYGVMLRDVELLRQYRFHYAILDESQAIKNPLAETSRAARTLNAEHRLVLTGTPVENSTLELWSQFAFLNPGLLGNLDYFREEFAGPIERKQDADTATFLRKMVYPFILRRTKDQVALDLPPRSEEILITEMEPAQRKLYIKTRDQYRAMLLGMIDNDGMDDARMKILEGLLRLRQICNHPRLVDDKFRGASAKFELLIETLETLQAEGHKALIFSQFVQMLTIIREALDARKIPYAYLDGSTRNRQSVVDRFQNDPSIPFFLISLKAGGVGLNLTAADYVIHVDPWWNPAVEMQATDRTHRIGQTKPVFVYKLITKDTVEEKILKLQDQKRALVAQLISSEGGVFKSLTRDDVEVLFT